MGIGDIISVKIVINGTTMNLPARIVSDLGNQWEVEVQYADGEMNRLTVDK